MIVMHRRLVALLDQGRSRRWAERPIYNQAVSNVQTVARAFMETYAAGDADGLLACLTDNWVLHEEDGSTTSREAIAEITSAHAESFPEKSFEFRQEVIEGNRVAHHMTFTLVHSGPYHDLEPTGKHVVLHEMIFHRFESGQIAESWRMTFPDSVYEALAPGAAS
jgi:C-1 hydroxylase